MADLLTYPLQDGFETTLSQSWNGAAGTVYVNSTPSFTFPSGVTTYVVVDPGKSNMQVAKINAYDSSALTLTVSSTSVNKGASVAYTEQSHSVGAKVIISDNYQFRADIATAMNSKLDESGGTISGTLTVSGASAKIDASGAKLGLEVPQLTTAERIALSDDGLIVYDTTLGLFYQHKGGSWASIDTGTTTPNASTTVAGIVELATQTEFDAGTATGATGASLSATPTIVAAGIQKGDFVYGADAGGDDTYVVALTPVLGAYTTGQKLRFKVTTGNTGACTVDFGPGVKDIKTKDGADPVSGEIAAGEIIEVVYDGTNMVLQQPKQGTSSIKGILQLATAAEALAGTDTAKAVTPAGLYQAVIGGDYDREFTMIWGSDEVADLTSAYNLVNYGDVYMVATNGNVNGYIANKVPLIGGAGFCAVTNVSVIEIESDVLRTAATNTNLFALATEATGLYDDANVEDCIQLKGVPASDQVILYSSDGSTSSNSGNLTATGVNWNNFKIVFTVGVDIKLYLNGVLLHTKTTNLPNSGDIYVGFGCPEDTKTVTFTPIKVRVKYV